MGASVSLQGRFSHDMDSQFPYYGLLLVVYRDLSDFGFQRDSFTRNVGLSIPVLVQQPLFHCAQLEWCLTQFSYVFRSYFVI